MGSFAQSTKWNRPRECSLFFESLENRRLLANQSGLVLSLDGEDDYAQALDHPSLDLGDGEDADFTIEASFYVFNEESRGKQTLVSKEDAYQLSIDFDTSGKDVIFLDLWSLQNTQSLSAETDIAAGWHHIAAVMDNESPPNEDRVALYLDGQRLRDSPDFITRIFNSDQPLQVGAFASKELFKGAIDEVRLSDSVRYAGPTYTVPSTPFTSDDDTRALWNFDQPRFDEMKRAEVFPDQSPHDNLLIAQNGATAGDPPGGDQKPLVALSLSAPILPESGAEAKVTATLSSPSDHDVTVDLAFAGNAVHPSDYTRDAATIVIPAGTLSGHLTLTSVDDPLHEGTETIVIEITNVSNGVERGTQQVSVGILDDDPTPTVRLSLSDSSVAEGAQAIVTATLSTVSYRDVIVDLEFGGSASHPDDYVRDATSIVIPAETLSASIKLVSVDDALDEPNETIVINITNVANAWVSGEQQVSAVVLDDDLAPAVRLSVSHSHIEEAGGETVVTATLSSISARGVTIDLEFVGTASYPDDYTRTASSIVIEAGTVSESITLTSIGDSVAEADETIVVRISDVTSAIELRPQDVVVVILDNEVPSLSLNTPSPVNEGEMAILTGAISNSPNRPFRVELDWGDRENHELVLPAGATSFTTSHLYRDDPMATVSDQFVINARFIESKRSDSVLSASTRIEVSNVAPAVSVGPDAFVEEGGQITAVGSFVDPSTLDTFRAMVDYGDGSGVQPLSLNLDRTFSLSHTYSAAGQYGITVTIIDDDEGLGSATLFAQVYDPSMPALGPEFPVNSTLNRDQQKPAVAVDGDGDYVIVWEGAGPGDEHGVFAQLYDRHGLEVGAEFRVNVRAEEHQIDPSVAMSATGDFVVVWASGDPSVPQWDIFAQRFDSTGDRLGLPFQVNRTSNHRQEDPTIAMNATGHFVVAWESWDQDRAGWEVYSRRFNSDGVPDGDEFRVNSFLRGQQRRPAAAMDASGNFVIGWEGEGATDDEGVHFRIYDAFGIPMSSEVDVNSHTKNLQDDVSVAMAPGGDFVVSWTSWLQDGSDGGIFGKRFSPDGVQLGEEAEFQVNKTWQHDQGNSDVAIDSMGNIIATWGSWAQDGSDGGVYGRKFYATTMTWGPEFAVNTFTESTQSHPEVAMGNNGNLLVAWISAEQDAAGSLGVYGQRLMQRSDSHGPMVGAIFVVGDSHQIDEGERLVRDFNKLVVAFSEDVPFNGAVSNVDSWSLSRNGVEILHGVSNVTYGFNPSTNKHEALVILDANGSEDGAPPLSDGLYTITINDSVRDIAGNPLDGDYDGVAGGAFTREFQITQPTGRDEIAVNTTMAGTQFDPQIAISPGGNYAIAWSSAADGDLSSSDVYGRFFDKTGTAIGGDVRLHPETDRKQNGVSIAAGRNGSYVAVWNNEKVPGKEVEIVGQRFDAMGKKIGEQFSVSESTVTNGSASVSVSPDDGFWVVWKDNEASRVVARRFDQMAMPLDDEEFQVNGQINDAKKIPVEKIPDEKDPRVAIDAHGNAVIVWSSFEHDGSEFGVFARRYDASGRPLDDGEFRVNNRRATDQLQARVARAADSGFVVVWIGQSDVDEPSEVFGQLYDASGEKVGTEFRIHDANRFNSHAPEVSMDDDGDFAVVWRVSSSTTESVGFRLQRFSVDGIRQGPLQVVANISVDDSAVRQFGSSGQVGMDNDGDFVVTWHSAAAGGDGLDVFARHYQAPGSISGVVWNDINRDHVHDGGESGLEDRTVELRRVRTEIEMPTILSFPTSPAGPENSLHKVAAIGTEHVAVTGTVDDVETVYLFNVETGERLLPEFASKSSSPEGFGSSLAGYGDNVLIGAMRHNNTGIVRLFNTTSGTVIREFTNPNRENPNPAAKDLFGASIATSGPFVLIGAPNEASARGAAYLYDADGEKPIRTFRSRNPQPEDGFGGHVAASADYAYVSAAFQDVGGFDDVGKVYVFDLAAGEFSHVISSPVTAVNQVFGGSLAAFNDTLVVAAHAADIGASNNGRVYVFDGPSGELRYIIESPLLQADQFFGDSVSIGEAGILVGAQGHDWGAKRDGVAYLFDEVTGELLHVFANPSPRDSEYFGGNATLIGNQAVMTQLPKADDADVAYAFNISRAPTTTSTLADGTFRFENVEPGWYTVHSQDSRAIPFPVQVTAAHETTGVNIGIQGVIGDLNDDGKRTVEDIDLLTEAVITGDNDPAFDLNGDRQIDKSDVTTFLTLDSNVPGDTDLNGDVSFADFLALSANFGKNVKEWSKGDFNVSGDVTFADFLTLSANFGATAAAIPAQKPAGFTPLPDTSDENDEPPDVAEWLFEDLIKHIADTEHPEAASRTR